MNKRFIGRLSLLFSLACALVLSLSTATIYAAAVGQAIASPENGWQRYDDRYVKSTMARGKDNAYYQSTGTSTKEVGRNIKFQFYGSNIRLLTFSSTKDHATEVSVKIDGVPYKYSEAYDAKTLTLVFEKTGLEKGLHDVIIESIQSGKFTSLDAIDIDDDGYIVPMNTPAQLKAASGNAQAILSWNEIEEATGYTVYFGTEAGKYTDEVSVTKDAYGNYVIPGLTNGTTYYFVVTATVNGVESERSMEASTTPQAEVAGEAVLNVTIAEDTVKVGDAFKAAISLDHVSDIYAEDFKIKYDTERFEYMGFDEVEGFKVYNTTTDEDDNIRFIVASQGEQYGITGEKVFLNLNFKAKAVGSGDVDALYCRIANTTIEWDLEGDACGSDTVTVELADIQDVNHSGEYTLVDLAIDGFYFGRAAADTDTINHSADQIVDGNVNDDDLVYIVNQMLSNTNYAPNLL
ncbi:cohesin domain-containing protein [Paenibacillus sp. FSL K6-1230]